MSTDAPLARHEPRSANELFLLRALRHGIDAGSLASNAHEQIMVGLSRVASRDMDALVLRESHDAAREIALSGALHRASLGLEYGAEGDQERAIALLSDGAITAATNTGAALLARIREQGESTGAALRMTSGLPTALSILDELYLANTVEDMFLQEIAQGRMTATAATPRLTEPLPPRWIASLADVRVVSGILGHLDARVELFRSFPRDRLFAQTYPPDALGGSDSIAVTRVFVLAVISGAPEPRFHLTDVDVGSFPADGFESPVLSRWITEYTSTSLPQGVQKSAAAYLNACLAAAPGSLHNLL